VTCDDATCLTTTAAVWVRLRGGITLCLRCYRSWTKGSQRPHTNPNP
jgi:hypothetical protein